MKIQKTKKWGKRILIGLLIAIGLSIAAPSMISGSIDNGNHTAYAATEACKTSGNTAAECTISSGGSCPSDYKADTTNPLLCKKNTTSTATTEQAINMMKFLVQITEVLNKAIWPVLVMIGGLMDNSLLFGNGMEERLREIWIPIRNIVNILFVVALVAIAIYNVLGIGDENSNYSIKAILPKIIIGIIAVNFSFLGIKLFLDGVNVLTSAIFQLPNQIGGELVLDPTNDAHKDIIDKYCRLKSDKDYNEILDKVVIDKENENAIYQHIASSSGYKQFFPNLKATSTKDEIITMMNNSTMTEAQKESFNSAVKDNKDGMICTVDANNNKMILTTRGELFLKRWNARNSALAMALGLSKIVFFKELNLSVDNIDKLVVNTVLSVVLYLLYVASFIALFVVLLGRLVVMWLAIALSPVLLLGMAVPAIKEQVSGFGDVTNIFVQNAIAPLGIGLSLSIGWIMLKALQGLNALESGGTISLTATEGIPVVGLTTIQDLIVGVGTIAVIWLGVFTAASKSIAAPVTDWMKNGIKTAGTWLGTLPLKHAPIFKIDLPGPDDDKNNTYTWNQVSEAMAGFTGRPKNSDLLYQRLTGQKKVAATDFTTVSSTDELLKNLSAARKQGMSAAELKSAVETMHKRNNPVYRNLKTDARYSGLYDEMEKLRTSKNAGEANAARNKIYDHNGVKGYSGSTAPAAKPATGGKKIGGIDVNATQVTKINQKVDLLKTSANTTNAAEIDKAVRAVADEVPKTARNAKGIQDALGADLYAKVLKNGYGGKSNDLLKAFTEGTKK